MATYNASAFARIKKMDVKFLILSFDVVVAFGARNGIGIEQKDNVSKKYNDIVSKSQQIAAR